MQLRNPIVSHPKGYHTDQAVPVAFVNVANGICGLDASARVPIAQLLNGVPTGTIQMYGGATAPTSWLLCDGAAVSRTTYAALFTVIGTTYGIGDGSTTFNTPDFLGRAVIGAGAGAGLTVRNRGDKAGEETHILSVAELAAHDHGSAGSHTHNTIADHSHTVNIASGAQTTNQAAPGTATTQGTEATSAAGGHTHTADGVHTHTSVGTGAGHNTMMPFGVATYIIKT